MKLSDVNSGANTALHGYCNITPRAAAVNLAINAASAATLKSNAAIQYTNNGVMLYKAALSAQSFAPTGTLNYVQPVSTTVYYTIGLDGSGNVSVIQGSYAGQNLSGGQIGASRVGDGSIPDVPAGVTPIGVVKVVTNGSTTFTPGTTALDNAGVTVTYFDVAVLPSGLL